MRTRKRVRLDRRTKVLEFRDDETTRYAILSHRWIERQGDRQGVSYEKMVELASWRKRIRQRVDYQKILDNCLQAKNHGCSGWTHVAQTNEAARNYLRPSTTCIRGKQTRPYAMRTFPKRLRATRMDIPILTALHVRKKYGVWVDLSRALQQLSLLGHEDE